MIASLVRQCVCAAVLVAAAPSFAQAQAVPRVKAKLVAVDGNLLTLAPIASAPPAKADGPQADSAAPLTVSLTPETRFVASTPAAFGAIAVGGYAGAAVSEGRGGALKALEVFVYADALRGTGEGRFTDNGRLLINGTVSAVAPGANGGTVTLHYRGAVLNGAGAGKTVCEGRAVPPAFASALACAADAAIEVAAGTPISALTVGGKELLVPGAIVSAAIATLPDGRKVTPGVIVEKAATTP